MTDHPEEEMSGTVRGAQGLPMRPAAGDRIAWLREAYGTRLLALVTGEERERDRSAIQASRARRVTAKSVAAEDTISEDTISEDDVFGAYREADPTPRGRYLDWVLRLALGGKLPAEDLPKARETLEAFERYKRRLPAEARDIGRYETLGDVWIAVEPFAATNAPTSAKEEDRREREAARAESDIVVEEEDIVIAIPKTERAAKWWGRGTRWCTASDQDNMFNDYNTEGPLVVLIIHGAKFQFHRQSDQFMDDADRACDIERFPGPVRRRIQELSPALHATVFYDLPGHPDDPVELIKRGKLESSPRNSRSKTVLAAVGVIREAIVRFGMYSRLLPHKYWSEAVAVAAISREEEQLACLPEKLLTKAVFLAAIGRLPSTASAIRLMPKAWIDQDVVEKVLSTRAAVLKEIDIRRPDLVTQELCLRHLRDHPRELDCVPERYLTEEIVADCISRNYWAFKHAPRHLLTADAVRPAIIAMPFLLRDVPQHAMDADLCRISSGNPLQFKYIPDWIIDDVEFSADALSRAIEMHGRNHCGTDQVLEMVDRIPPRVMAEIRDGYAEIKAWVDQHASQEAREEWKRKWDDILSNAPF